MVKDAENAGRGQRKYKHPFLGGIVFPALVYQAE